MAKTGKWLDLCRQACSEHDPRRMIELAQQAVELWDVEHKPVNKQNAQHGKAESGSDPHSKNT